MWLQGFFRIYLQQIIPHTPRGLAIPYHWGAFRPTTQAQPLLFSVGVIFISERNLLGNMCMRLIVPMLCLYKICYVSVLLYILAPWIAGQVKFRIFKEVIFFRRVQSIFMIFYSRSRTMMLRIRPCRWRTWHSYTAST